MNLRISKKQAGLIFLVILLLVSFVAGAYFLFIKPVNDQLERKQSELKMANQGLEMIENSLKRSTEKTIENSMELQKKVPVKRLLDQLLLNIDKAEIISDTTINEIKLNGSAEDEEIAFETDETETEQTEPENIETTETETENTEAIDSTKILEEKLPNGIKKVSITMNGEALTYFELEKFISSLESLQRIVKVEALKFTGLEEIHSVEQEEQKVQFELTVAGYYFPNLEDLRDELPPLDTPEIANKKNPLSQFSEEEDQDTEEKQP